MNITNMKDFPYFRRSHSSTAGEVYFPLNTTLPNGMAEYHIVLSHDGVEHEVLAISKVPTQPETVVHTVDGLFKFEPREDFRINVYKNTLFVSA